MRTLSVNEINQLSSVERSDYPDEIINLWNAEDRQKKDYTPQSKRNYDSKFWPGELGFHILNVYIVQALQNVLGNLRENTNLTSEEMNCLNAIDNTFYADLLACKTKSRLHRMEDRPCVAEAVDVASTNLERHFKRRLTNTI